MGGGHSPNLINSKPLCKNFKGIIKDVSSACSICLEYNPDKAIQVGQGYELKGQGSFEFL